MNVPYEIVVVDSATLYGPYSRAAQLLEPLWAEYIAEARRLDAADVARMKAMLDQADEKRKAWSAANNLAFEAFKKAHAAWRKKIFFKGPEPVYVGTYPPSMNEPINHLAFRVYRTEAVCRVRSELEQMLDALGRAEVLHMTVQQFNRFKEWENGYVVTQVTERTLYG